MRSSSMWRAASFFGMRSKSPLARRASSCSSRPSRFLMVTKFVSMPPSQRWFTYGWPARSASWAIGSWACFLVPTKRTASPRAVVSRTAASATSSRCDGLGEVDDVDPVALREDERAHLGIPAAGLVAEVNAGLEQLPHGDGGHAWSSCSVASSAGPDPDRVARASCSAPRHRPGSVAAPRVISSPRMRHDGAAGRPDGRGGVYHRGPPSPGLADPAGDGAGREATRRWRAGSTATRSRRSGSAGRREPSGSGPAATPARPRRGAAARLAVRRAVSSGRPKARERRQRTSTTTSEGGGPGSTATMSSSRRPTRTRAAEDPPAGRGERARDRLLGRDRRPAAAGVRVVGGVARPSPQASGRDRISGLSRDHPGGAARHDPPPTPRGGRPLGRERPARPARADRRPGRVRAAPRPRWRAGS